MPIYRVTYFMPTFMDQTRSYQIDMAYTPKTEILELTEEQAGDCETKHLIFANLTTRGEEPISEDLKLVRMKMDYSYSKSKKFMDEHDEDGCKTIYNWSFPLISIEKL